VRVGPHWGTLPGTCREGGRAVCGPRARQLVTGSAHRVWLRYVQMFDGWAARMRRGRLPRLPAPQIKQRAPARPSTRPRPHLTLSGWSRTAKVRARRKPSRSRSSRSNSVTRPPSWPTAKPWDAGQSGSNRAPWDRIGLKVLRQSRSVDAAAVAMFSLLPHQPRLPCPLLLQFSLNGPCQCRPAQGPAI
jgi:hypothetical protein